MKKKKIPSPTKKKQTPKRSVTVKSEKGLIHEIDDIQELETLAEEILQKFFLDNKLQLAQSLKFEQLVEGLTLSNEFLIEYKTLETVRICFGGFDPLSVAGSLATGGRLNIGGAQITTKLNNRYAMAASMYTACTVDCAKAETGPHMNAEIYYIKSLHPIKLWDMSSLVNAQQASSTILTAIGANPFNMSWGLQKFPTASQILATKLRGIGGDGIFLPSTKHSGGFVYSFFAKDDADMKNKFSATKIQENQLQLPIK